MATRTIKSLGRTGRVSRKKASATAKKIRTQLKSGSIKIAHGKKIRAKSTASGRGAISFHVSGPITSTRLVKGRKANSKGAS